MKKEDLEEIEEINDLKKNMIIDMTTTFIVGYAWYDYAFSRNKKIVEKLDIFFLLDVIVNVGYVLFIGIALYIGVRKIVKGVLNIFWRE